MAAHFQFSGGTISLHLDDYGFKRVINKGAVCQKVILSDEELIYVCNSFPELEIVPTDEVVTVEGETAQFIAEKWGTTYITRALEARERYEQEHGPFPVAQKIAEEWGRE